MLLGRLWVAPTQSSGGHAEEPVQPLSPSDTYVHPAPQASGGALIAEIKPRNFRLVFFPLGVLVVVAVDHSQILVVHPMAHPMAQAHTHFHHHRTQQREGLRG